MSTDHKPRFFSLLKGRVIAFRPELARIAGSAGAGLYLAQLAFWSNKGGDPEWFFKSEREIEEETCLTRDEQAGARRALVMRGFLQVERRGLPARLYYHLHEDAIEAALLTLARVSAAHTLPVAENPQLDAEKLHQDRGKHAACGPKIRNLDTEKARNGVGFSASAVTDDTEMITEREQRSPSRPCNDQPQAFRPRSPRPRSTQPTSVISLEAATVTDQMRAAAAALNLDAAKVWDRFRSRRAARGRRGWHDQAALEADFGAFSAAYAETERSAGRVPAPSIRNGAAPPALPAPLTDADHEAIMARMHARKARKQTTDATTS